jgi:hypothetical protein
MNIYVVRRTDCENIGYNDYTGFVVVAAHEIEAVAIANETARAEFKREKTDHGWRPINAGWGVKHVGTAIDPTPRIIFHAQNDG